jgi:predicted RNA-binding protein
MTYWIVVGSEENMRIAEARGFDIFGFKSTRRREVAQMQPGDRLIFYLTKIMKFGGLAEVTSEYFEDHERVFRSDKPARPGKPAEDYPFRVNVKPEIVLAPEQYLDVKEIAPRMAYTKKWPAEHWRLAFQGNLHQIPAEDFEMIVSEMKAAVGARA